MPVKPLQDWVLIEPATTKDKSDGGMIIPDSVREKSQGGQVIAVGGGRFVEEKDKKGKLKKRQFVKTSLQPGDKIIYEDYAVRRIEFEGEELLLVREEDVLGIV